MFSDVQVTILPDAHATERSIGAAFERLASVVKPRDVFVLFLAGHGKSVGKLGWFFIPQDLGTNADQRSETHGIGQAKLEAWVAKIPAGHRPQATAPILDPTDPEDFRGHNQSSKAHLGVKFADGLEVAAMPTGRRPAAAA